MIFGVKEVERIETKLRQLGIHDVVLLFEPNIERWAVFQVEAQIASHFMPDTYDPRLAPHLMFWIKNKQGNSRVPAEQDLSDIAIIVKRAHKIWDTGINVDDQLVKKEEKQRVQYQAKKKAMAQDVARRLNQAAKRTVHV